MMNRRPNSARSPWRILLVLLCAVLVLAAATVELTHTHTDGSHADCSLCVTAHMAAQVISAPALLVLFARIAAVALAARMLLLAKASIFDLFTRPPPVCLNAA